jgi:hypothetical protein
VTEHDRDHFEVPPGASERYTLVELTAFPGRSSEAKRALYRAIVRELSNVGVKGDDISVVIHEPRCRTGGSAEAAQPTKSISGTDSTSEPFTARRAGGGPVSR